MFDGMYVRDIAPGTVIGECEMYHFFVKYKVHFGSRGFRRCYFTLRNAGFLTLSNTKSSNPLYPRKCILHANFQYGMH